MRRTLAALVCRGALAIAPLAGAAMPAQQAFACGDAEGSGACTDSNSAAQESRWMLQRAAIAVQADEMKALDQFTHGQGGFRTQDLYVFCMNGSDGRITAHPDSRLMGQDARTLHDPTGKAFAAEMLDVAKEHTIAEVSYLYPRPGSNSPVPKTAYVTRINNQVCGVGYYDDLLAQDSSNPAAASELTQLQERLDSAMPNELRPDWAAFLRALDEQRSAQKAALAKVRVGVQGAEAALAGEHSTSYQ